MSEIKQDDNAKLFFEKYGFMQTCTMKHPEFNDTIKFTGLEAHYVSMLENKIKNLETYIKLQHDKIDYLMNKEFLKYKFEQTK
jgi:hypothetical protein